MTVKLTKWVLLGLALFVLIYDLIVVLNDIPGDTISAVVVGWAGEYQTLPFGMGVVMGHLFWPVKKVTHQVARGVILGIVVVGALILDGTLIETLYPLWPFLVGFAIGRLLWPMAMRRGLRRY